MHVRLLGVVVVMALCSQARADDLAARNDALIKRGFNYTHGVTATTRQTLSILVPPSDDAFEIVLDFAASAGEVEVVMTGPTAGTASVARWQGARGAVDIRRTLPPGRYTVTVSPTAGAQVRGIVGLKGPVVGECALDAARVTERPAAKGFAWPYLLARPKQPATRTAVLVAPNNSGFATEDLDLLRANASCTMLGALAIADRLGTAVLVPMFPRPPQGSTNLYLHALTRAALIVKTIAHARVDLQLIAMIDDARAELATQKVEVDKRVLIAGFSASGSFANRFALLHPDRTLAAAVGSPGGWPTVPVIKDGRDLLSYPIGIADLSSLTGVRVDTTALRRVRFLFFLGDADTNDAVVFRDSFSAAGERLVVRKYGKTPVERWKHAQRLYEAARLQATFKLYPGVAHEVTPAMAADIERMFRAVLAR
jgi:dienelactone hydrolase